MLPYFQSIDIDNLSVISEDIDRALPELITGKFDFKSIYSFNLIDTNLLKTTSSALSEWLNNLGLYGHLLYAGLPWIAPCSQGSIHSDGKCKEAINIPVFNCEQGWMIWYEAEKFGDILSTSSGNSAKHQTAEYVPYKHDGAKEITRLNSNQAAWVNTEIPHRGSNLSSKPRIILTLRFDISIANMVCK